VTQRSLQLIILMPIYTYIEDKLFIKLTHSFANLLDNTYQPLSD